jgi:uncharacterized membrane protein YoaK (UPF0700 family)
MKTPNGPAAVAALLAFNGGFVDAAGFLGLQGLFVAHVTGNFVTLGAALVLGGHGVYGKILALPEFVLAIALARFAGVTLRKRNAPALPVLLAAETGLLVGFFILAVTFGPFPDPDSAPALLTAFPALPPWRCRTPCSACISAISRRPRS